MKQAHVQLCKIYEHNVYTSVLIPQLMLQTNAVERVPSSLVVMVYDMSRLV